MANFEESTSQKVASVLFGLLLVFCSMEMVSGWGIFDLGWPESTFYIIMIVAGTISGFLWAPDHRLAGLAGGFVAGAFCLYPVALYLKHIDWVHTVIIAILAGLGCLPGFLLYLLISKLQGDKPLSFDMEPLEIQELPDEENVSKRFNRDNSTDQK